MFFGFLAVGVGVANAYADFYVTLETSPLPSQIVQGC